MARRAAPWLADRGAAALALVVPTSAGLTYLVTFGASNAFVALNAVALAIGLTAIAFVRVPSDPMTRRLLAVGLIGLLAVPIAIGPSLDGVSRWLAVGGLTIHAGMLVIPLLIRLLAGDRTIGPWLTLAAILAAFAQPDSASALALALAAVGIAICDRNSLWFAIGMLGLAASLGASFSVNLPPEQFVEQVIPELWQNHPMTALAMCASFVVGTTLVAQCSHIDRKGRVAICSTLFGFMLAAVLGDYPYPLIGFGAAPILGLGLALMRSSGAKREDLL